MGVRRFTSTTASMAIAAALATLAMPACLGRTGISGEDLAALGVSDPRDGATADGGGEDTTTSPDTAPPPPDTAKTDAGPDRFIDIWEVLPVPDGGPIGDCLSCVRDKCGKSVNDCINSPACRSGLACTITTCAGGGGGPLGGLDIACVSKCFGGDFKAAGTAISTFSCLLGTCGSKCGGLLGGGLGGGDAGPKPDAPAPPKETGGAEAGGSGGSPGSFGSPGGGGLPAMPGLDGPRFVPSQGLTEEQFLALPPGTTLHFYPEALSPWAEQLRETACAEKMISCDP